MIRDDSHFLYVEKYRPSTIEDTILPKRYKEKFEEILESGDLQHLILSGGAGIGKTTIAKAICSELKSDVMTINASEKGNIDTLRTDIREFASSLSMFGKKKIIILDEADYLNPQSTQPALRSFMEEFSKNCRFIMTCNYINRIIEPLRSRCKVIEFSYTKEEKLEVATLFMKRVKDILEVEEVPYDKVVVGQLIKKFFPDMRKTLNELQSNIYNGQLNKDLIFALSDTGIDNVRKMLKDKEFTKLREWCAQNTDLQFAELERKIYDNVDDMLVDTSIPSMVMLLNQYDERTAFVADKEINMMSFFTECMMSLEFK